MFKRVHLEGEVLTPIHITGLTVQSLRKYLNRIYNVKSEFKRLIGKNREIENYFARIENNIKELLKYSKDWRCFIKDNNGNPLIPGSSLKGAFSSAIEHYKGWTLNDPLRIQAFQNLSFRDVYLNNDNLIKADIFISSNLILKDVEVLKPRTKFLIEMIYKENSFLKFEEIFVYPALKTLKIIDLIIKKGKGNYLTNKILNYYNNFVSKFGDNFNSIDLKEAFNFIKENGFIIRLGKYTGKLCKITLDAFNKEYNNVLQGELKYIGRLANNYLMGFVKLKIIKIEEK